MKLLVRLQPWLQRWWRAWPICWDFLERRTTLISAMKLLLKGQKTLAQCEPRIERAPSCGLILLPALASHKAI